MTLRKAICECRGVNAPSFDNRLNEDEESCTQCEFGCQVMQMQNAIIYLCDIEESRNYQREN